MPIICEKRGQVGVLTLSRPDKTAVPAILAFIHTHDGMHGE